MEEARRLVISDLISRGKTPSEIAKTIGCSRTTVYSVRNMIMERGTVKKNVRLRPRSVRTPEMLDSGRGLIQEEPRISPILKHLPRHFGQRSIPMGQENVWKSLEFGAGWC